MIGRVLLAVLLAGIAAGFVMGVIQHVRLTPLIVQAEQVETAPAGSASHEHDSKAWEPANSFQRTLFTSLMTMVTGAGFAAVLAGMSFLLSIPITRANGLLWGLCGFCAVALAPAAGLPPELPGIPVADITLRQVWWVATIAFTACGLWLLITRREIWAITVAILIILVPHLIGAPQSVSHETALSASLTQRFVASSLAANGFFWSLIGVFLGLALEQFEKDAGQ